MCINLRIVFDTIFLQQANDPSPLLPSQCVCRIYVPICLGFTVSVVPVLWERDQQNIQTNVITINMQTHFTRRFENLSCFELWALVISPSEHQLICTTHHSQDSLTGSTSKQVLDMTAFCTNASDKTRPLSYEFDRALSKIAFQKFKSRCKILSHLLWLWSGTSIYFDDAKYPVSRKLLWRKTARSFLSGEARSKISSFKGVGRNLSPERRYLGFSHFRWPKFLLTSSAAQPHLPTDASKSVGAIHLLRTHKFPDFRPPHSPCTHKLWRHYENNT